MAPSSSSSTSASASATACRHHRTGQWTTDEHERFIDARTLHPTATWRVIAAYVGTRSTRQCMTHANKIAEKAERMNRGLRPAGRPRRGTTKTSGPVSKRRCKRPCESPHKAPHSTTSTIPTTMEEPITSSRLDFSDGLLEALGADDGLLMPTCWTATPLFKPVAVPSSPCVLGSFECGAMDLSLLLDVDECEFDSSISML